MSDERSRPAADAVVAARMGGGRTPLRYGRWSMELRGDEVADVRYDGVLLLRAVRPVVRDEDWNTLAVHVADPPGAGTRSSVTLALGFGAEGTAYEVTLEVRLGEDELVVDFDGRAPSAGRFNRIGLVVLHPAAEAGRPVTVRHPDGSSTDGRWPEQISPHQPFLDVAGFAWERDGVTAELALEGDVFEDEDQRNWTDASFKTYSTPLSRPFPVAVAAGETRRQQVRLRVAGRAHPPARPAAPADEVTVGPAVVGHLPPLSLGAALHPAPATPPDLGPGWDAVLVELVGTEDDWPAALAVAAAQASALGAGLDVRLVTADPPALERGVRLLAGLPVRRLGAFDPETHLSTEPLWAALQSAAVAAGYGGLLLGGTRAHYTELNRGRQQLPGDLPALTFSLTPTMHASEVPHLVDSLATQRTVVRDALALAAGRPLHVGPVTLARRFNAVATSARPDPATEAARAVDPLQPTAFAAAWTLGSVQALAVPGVAGLSYFETTGPRGVHDATGPTPAGRLLAALAAARGRPRLETTGPDDLAVLALATEDGGAEDGAVGDGPVELHLANLTPDDRTVTVRSAGGSRRLALGGWAVEHLRLG